MPLKNQQYFTIYKYICKKLFIRNDKSKEKSFMQIEKILMQNEVGKKNRINLRKFLLNRQKPDKEGQKIEKPKNPKIPLKQSTAHIQKTSLSTSSSIPQLNLQKSAQIASLCLQSKFTKQYHQPQISQLPINSIENLGQISTKASLTSESKENPSISPNCSNQSELFKQYETLHCLYYQNLKTLTEQTVEQISLVEQQVTDIELSDSIQQFQASIYKLQLELLHLKMHNLSTQQLSTPLESIPVNVPKMYSCQEVLAQRIRHEKQKHIRLNQKLFALTSQQQQLKSALGLLKLRQPKIPKKKPHQLSILRKMKSSKSKTPFSHSNKQNFPSNFNFN